MAMDEADYRKMATASVPEQPRLSDNISFIVQLFNCIDSLNTSIDNLRTNLEPVIVLSDQIDSNPTPVPANKLDELVQLLQRATSRVTALDREVQL